VRFAAPETEAAEAARFDLLATAQRFHDAPNTVSTTISAHPFVKPATAAPSLMSATFVKLPSVMSSRRRTYGA